MSDITATNCGCDCDNRCDCEGRSCGFFRRNDDCCSLIWLIILLSFCGCGNGFFRSGNDCDNNSCIWIILILFFCGGFGNGFGCGC